MDVEVAGKVVDTVEAGQTFGELNLLYDTELSMAMDPKTKATGKKKDTAPTIRNSSTTGEIAKILRLDQEAYRGIVQAHSKKEEDEKRQMIDKVTVLQQMIPKNDRKKNNETAKKLTSIMKPVSFEKDKILVDKEQVGDTFFIVQDGHIRVTTEQNQAATYGPGDFFGKRALGVNTNEPSEVKITGLDNGNVYSIDKKTLDKVLSENHLQRTKAKAQDTKKLVSEMAAACKPTSQQVDRVDLSCVSHVLFFYCAKTCR